jgi:hypothetical protein
VLLWVLNPLLHTQICQDVLGCDAHVFKTDTHVVGSFAGCWVQNGQGDSNTLAVRIYAALHVLAAGQSFFGFGGCAVDQSLPFSSGKTCPPASNWLMAMV